MYSLEENNAWLSDGTYLAFKDFMKNIMPEYIKKGIDSKAKEVYIPIKKEEDFVYIGNHNLGSINYHEFISYIYGLHSFNGLILDNINNISENFNIPFDLEQLMRDYYMELQEDEYYTFDNNPKELKEQRGVSYTYLVYERFISHTIIEILKEASEGKYEMVDVLDSDGITVLSRILNIPLEIKYDEFYIGEHDLGKINCLEFLNYLTSMPSYAGMIYDDLNQKITFNVELLLRDYHNDFCRK